MRSILPDRRRGSGGAAPRLAGTMPAMAQHVTDRDSLLKALAPLRDGLFFGTDLVYDEQSRTMTLTLTCPDTASAGGGGHGFFLRPGKNSYRRHAIQVRRIVSYKQSLVADPGEVYVL